MHAVDRFADTFALKPLADGGNASSASSHEARTDSSASRSGLAALHRQRRLGEQVRTAETTGQRRCVAAGRQAPRELTGGFQRTRSPQQEPAPTIVVDVAGTGAIGGR